MRSTNSLHQVRLSFPSFAHVRALSLDVDPRSSCGFRLGMTHHCTSPPSPLSNSTSFRGEGEPEKRGSFPPLHAALRSNAKLERGLGGEARVLQGTSG